jgi:diaminopropionate ammonia-lyase
VTRVQLVANGGRASDDAARAAAAELLPESGFLQARAAISAWSGYSPSPLVDLPGLAARLGLGRIAVKDESERFGLGSFKALGGAYAVRKLAAECPGITVTSATDGNHGRAVAWAAQQSGCRCVIYLHEHVHTSREEAIARYGAEIVRTSGTYDDSARQCLADAEANGWTVVSDTAPTSDFGLALDVMQGYRVLADEALDQLEKRPPSHVFVQAGCGGLAAAVLAHLLARTDGRPPTFVVVEPEDAPCLYLSAVAGEPVVAPGELDTVMAGLAVGEVSLPAWQILSAGADCFETVTDEAALGTMCLLAGGVDGDPRLVAGETGGAGLAGLIVAAAAPEVREELGLGAGSTVLILNTEGDTAPGDYERVVGTSSNEVRRSGGSPAVAVGATGGAHA